MRKDTWTVIGVMVALVGLLATFMVTGLASIESRLTAMNDRLTAIDGRLHDVNTRLSRIEGHLILPTDIEPISFETIALTLPTPDINPFKEDGRLILEPLARSLSPPWLLIPNEREGRFRQGLVLGPQPVPVVYRVVLPREHPTPHQDRLHCRMWNPAM